MASKKEQPSRMLSKRGQNRTGNSGDSNLDSGFLVEQDHLSPTDATFGGSQKGETDGRGSGITTEKSIMASMLEMFRELQSSEREARNIEFRKVEERWAEERRLAELRREEERKLAEERREEDKRQAEVRRVEEEGRREERELWVTRERREAEQIRRENEEKRAKEQQDLIHSLSGRSTLPGVVDGSHPPRMPMPVMKQGDDLEEFIETLETTLTLNSVPNKYWKNYLASQTLSKHVHPLKSLLIDVDTDYNTVKTMMTGSVVVTLATAMEGLFSGQLPEGLGKSLDEAARKVGKWAKSYTDGLDDLAAVTDRIVMGTLRAWMIPELKTFIDLEKPKTLPHFKSLVEQWKTNNQHKQVTFITKRSDNYGSSGKNFGAGGKKIFTCFQCGKPGHIAADCRVRQHETPKVVNTTETSTVKCFKCGVKGHKAPQCPQKKKPQVKAITVDDAQIEELNRNDAIAEANGYLIPITFDSGAAVSLIPREFVSVRDYTGKKRRFKGVLTKYDWEEAPEVMITMHCGPVSFTDKMLAVPGEDLGWHGVIQHDLRDAEKTEQATKAMRWTAGLAKGVVRYIPPKMDQGTAKGAVVVPDGVGSVEVQEVPQSDEVVEVAQEEEAVEDVAEVDCEALRGIAAESSVSEEAERADSLEGSAVIGIQVDDGSDSEVTNPTNETSTTGDELQEFPEVTVLTEGSNERDRLAKATSSDHSLRPYVNLGRKSQNGFELEKDLLFRRHLDELGRNTRQLCLPIEYREKVLLLVHDKAGHKGKNKMGAEVSKFFFWPGMWAEIGKYCKTCDTCQKFSKANPRPTPMMERQIITIPFQKVSIDLVGPLPTAKRGYKYLLTCVDEATRWPEAIPVRDPKSATVITLLTDIFSRNGFPAEVVSDNGPQFVSHQFEKFLRDHGIKHIKCSPYSPQSNGVVERFHGTLNSMIKKSVLKKGNWVDVVPMILFFVRTTPHTSTGFSPFLLKHGWEPVTPIQLLYKGWVQEELASLEIEQWVLENAERIQALRIAAEDKLSQNSSKRKEKLDQSSKQREFAVGDLVWYRAPGAETKLAPTW